MKETMIITFFLGAIYALAAGGVWLADNLPDIVWAILFLMLIAGFVVWLGRWYRETVEREAAEADIAKHPRTIILAPGVTLLQERGSTICTKPVVSRVIQVGNEWSCSDYEPRRRKVRQK